MSLYNLMEDLHSCAHQYCYTCRKGFHEEILNTSLICMCTDPLIYHVDNNTDIYFAVIVVLSIALALSIMVLIYMCRKMMNKPRREGIHFHFQFILRES